VPSNFDARKDNTSAAGRDFILTSSKNRPKMREKPPKKKNSLGTSLAV
jgi:hypothetical protein